jgi:hypothetical protein
VDNNKPSTSEEKRAASSSTESSYRGGFWDIFINGIRITPFDCPNCLNDEEFECSFCEFFVPETCRLRLDPFFAQDIRTLFQLFRERQAARRKARREHLRALVCAIYSELQTHGRPLHYAVLARIVADRHPELQVSEKRVLRAMASRPDKFERVTEGVYRCQRDK